jgi:hypothetical protein
MLAAPATVTWDCSDLCLVALLMGCSCLACPLQSVPVSQCLLLWPRLALTTPFLNSHLCHIAHLLCHPHGPPPKAQRTLVFRKYLWCLKWWKHYLFYWIKGGKRWLEKVCKFFGHLPFLSPCMMVYCSAQKPLNIPLKQVALTLFQLSHYWEKGKLSSWTLLKKSY